MKESFIRSKEKTSKENMAIQNFKWQIDLTELQVLKMNLYPPFFFTMKEYQKYKTLSTPLQKQTE